MGGPGRQPRARDRLPNDGGLAGARSRTRLRGRARGSDRGCPRSGLPAGSRRAHQALRAEAEHLADSYRPAAVDRCLRQPPGDRRGPAVTAVAAIAVDTARLPLLMAELRLPSIARLWPEFTERADREGWPAARLLAALAELELAERARRRVERHLAEAHLPPGKTFDSFDFAAVPMLRARPRSSVGFSVGCQPAHEQLDDRDDGHGGRGVDQALEVFGEAAVAAEPGEGALGHPAPRQQVEAGGIARALDDLELQSLGRGGVESDSALIA